MGPQRRLGIYFGYETSSIIRYVKPLTGDVFTTRFVDFHFNEAIFPSLGGEKKTHKKDVSWSKRSLLYLDPCTKQSETEHLKRGRPTGSKDKNPRKRKGTEKNFDHEENVLNETQDIKTSPEEEMNDMNKEMSINYSQTHILWERNEIGDIDEIFSYSAASDSMGGDDDLEPKSVIDCQSRPDWDKWKDAMQAKLNSLNKRNVFGPIVTTPRDVKPIGCRWIFVQKRNEKNEVTRYKARLVAQAVYVDDLNIIGINKEINKFVMHLKEDFEMKDLDKAKSLSTPMVGRSLNVGDDPFRSCEEGEDVLGPEVPYLSAIGALMYLTNSRDYKAEEELYSLNQVTVSSHPLLSSSSVADDKHQDYGNIEFFDPLRGISTQVVESIEDITVAEKHATNQATSHFSAKEWASFNKLLMQRFSSCEHNF
nr:retrovirus-related Pol polyprotein from transposon TNT 1-94 [Tanacetum cinerariifolium]